MFEDPPENPLEVLLFSLRRLLQLLPLASPRPAYPAIDDPAAGASVSGGITVRVSSNRPDLEHRVRVLNADDFSEISTMLVTFDQGNKGFANVIIPLATGPNSPATDFVLECAPTGGGNAHRIIVTRPATVPPVFGVTITANALPPYTAFQTVRFTANPTGGVGPFTWWWGGTDVMPGASGNFIDVTFTAPVMAGTISVFGHDSSQPQPISAFNSFGPFIVTF